MPRLRFLRTAALRFAVVARARLEGALFALVVTLDLGGPVLAACLRAWPTAPNGLCFAMSLIAVSVSLVLHILNELW